MAHENAPWVAADTAAHWTRRLLIAGLALSIVGIVSGLMQVDLISRATTTGISDAEAAVNDSRQQLIGVFQVAVYLGTVIAFLAWFHRSHKNLPALLNQNLKYTPGWAVGGFFVPFLNLVRPLQVMREIWHGSDPAGLDRDQPLSASLVRNKLPTPVLVGAWWALFLITAFVGRILLQMAAAEEQTLDELMTFSQLLVAADLVDIPATLAAFAIVGRITQWQSERYVLAAGVGHTVTTSGLDGAAAG